MNKIQQLIEELCPDGVEYKELGEVCLSVSAGGDLPEIFNKGQKFPTSEFPYPIYSNGCDDNALYGFTDKYKIDSDAVTISARGTIGYHTIREAKYTPIVRLISLIPNKELITTKFLNYILNMTPIGGTNGGIPQLTVPTVKKIQIPIPPLPIQQEIVKILDTFTALDASLQAELKARRKQYEHYRNQLLNFEGKDVEWKTLGEIGNVCMCKRVMKHETKPMDDIPFFKIGTFGKEPDAYISKALYEEYKSKFSFPKKGDILISASGTIGRRVIYDSNPAYFQDSNIVWLSNNEKIILNKLLYYIYETIDWPVEGGIIKRLYNENLKKIKIPIPPLSEQERIVSILDKFDALVNIELPAEIEARRKQYEYYREKLLTFEPLVN